MEGTDLVKRLRRLEDLEAIRQLKARYFACCDRKDTDGMRECFAVGKVLIDYGAIGVFDDRSKLIDVFQRLGCHEHIVEMHHGMNPDITVLDSDRAHGTWGLYYHQINTLEKTLTQLGATYDDAYVRTESGWKIAKTRCVITSSQVMRFTEAAPVVMFAGRSVPAA